MTKLDSKFDEIDRMFEELQKTNDVSVDNIRSNLTDNEGLLSMRDKIDPQRKVMVVSRPSLPKIPSSLKSRLDIFLYCLKNVDYGKDNNRSYVDGHIEALNRYLEQAKLNPNNLEVVLATVNDELRWKGKTSKIDLREKGYTDGLTYVGQALKKSKDVIAKDIDNILRRELNNE